MSTNYYITFRRAIDESIQKIHIAQYAAGGFLLQAIHGEDRFNTEQLPTSIEESATVQSSFYWSPVYGLDTVENWEQMKNLLSNPDFTIIDEYGVEVAAEDFINDVETQENGTDHRYHRMTDWLANQDSSNWFANSPRTDYIDKDGFSFETREFF